MRAVRPGASASAVEATRSLIAAHEVEEGKPKPFPVWAFVIGCFVLGVLIAGLYAWKTGRLGGSDGEERYVARATDAMYKNHFADPPGENVKEITDEGLQRYPNDPKILDVRVRAANALTTQAVAQRSAGDVLEALRLARLAHDLDANDASTKRLVEQYEAEVATFSSSAAPPLTKPPGFHLIRPARAASVPTSTKRSSTCRTPRRRSVSPWTSSRTSRRAQVISPIRALPSRDQACLRTRASPRARRNAARPVPPSLGCRCRQNGVEPGGLPPIPPGSGGLRSDKYKALVDVSNASPQVGQSVDLVAHVAPGTGDFADPGFTVAGPSVPPNTRVPATAVGPGTFKTSFTFTSAGKYDITFSTTVDGGKAITARRSLSAVGAPLLPSVTVIVPPAPAPAPAPAPPPAPAPAAPSGSVKWM